MFFILFMETTMKAIRIHTYGFGPVVYEDAPQPIPGEGEVLVRVHASAVNPVDNAIRGGFLTGYFQLQFPAILGYDVAGVVESIGPGVSEYKPGDAVFARPTFHRMGAFAEFAAIAVPEIAPKPKNLDLLQSAALPHVSLTAWRALIDTGGLSAGQKVLVLGATGGVGMAAVQLAKSRGAHVTGTTSAGNLSFLRELGADEAIDYNAGAFEDAARGMDIVLDAVGGETLDRAWKTLNPGGILVSIVQPPAEDKAAAHAVRAAMVGGTGPAGGVLKEIAALVEAGKIRPVVSTLLPLAETGRALDMIATKHTRGKIVLQVA
jgi:NADPH:quinone reductase-like Zn-dependent oxidoreductase